MLSALLFTDEIDYEIADGKVAIFPQVAQTGGEVGIIARFYVNLIFSLPAPPC